MNANFQRLMAGVTEVKEIPNDLNMKSGVPNQTIKVGPQRMMAELLDYARFRKDDEGDWSDSSPAGNDDSHDPAVKRAQ